MLHNQQATDDRRKHGSPPRELSQRELTRMLFDVCTSDLVLKGKLPGRLTQDEADAFVKTMNTPLTDAELEEMDRLSSIRGHSNFTKTQVYTILALYYEGKMNFNDLAKLFGVSTKYLSAIKRGAVWAGTFYRYCRDRNIDPDSLSAR